MVVKGLMIRFGGSADGSVDEVSMKVKWGRGGKALV